MPQGVLPYKYEEEKTQSGMTALAGLPVYRYLATKELLHQEALPGMEGPLPFHTMEMSSTHYKIFGIVTNRDNEGSQLINWLHERCGKSEEAHSIMKEDLAGGRLPSSDFGENAAWWWI